MEQCSLIYTGTHGGCHQCIIDGNCGDVNNGSRDADCGFSLGPHRLQRRAEPLPGGSAAMVFKSPIAVSCAALASA